MRIVKKPIIIAIIIGAGIAAIFGLVNSQDNSIPIEITDDSSENDISVTEEEKPKGRNLTLEFSESMAATTGP